MKIIFYLLCLICFFACKNVSKKSIPENEMKTTEVKTEVVSEIQPSPTAFGFKLTNIDGKPFNLKSYEGKKILIVNTASKCGYTPQYEGLQQLYEKYNDKLVIVGFPCNDFNGQEPGTTEEIKSFCKKNYGVTFPLSDKITVKGDAMAPLYKWLTQKSLNGVLDATIKWNFNKFLLNEKGELLAYFPSSTKPMDEAITSKL